MITCCVYLRVKFIKNIHYLKIAGICNCIQRFYCVFYNVNFVLRNVMENKCITVPVTACGNSQTFDTVIHLLSEI